MANEVGERTRRMPYTPLIQGLIQPEWLFMYYDWMEEPDDGEGPLPSETTGKEGEEKRASIRINFRARRDPAVPSK